MHSAANFTAPCTPPPSPSPLTPLVAVTHIWKVAGLNGSHVADYPACDFLQYMQAMSLFSSYRQGIMLNP